MSGDLETVERSVHAKARDVLAFWFELLMPEQHFAKSDSVDAAIRERFADLREELLETGARGWRDDPETLLAAVIVLDQFSRNLFRGDAEAYAADPLARELAIDAINRGWDRGMPDPHRQFLYMPLMHAEDIRLQQLSVAKFAETELEEALDYAYDHRDVIERYGRFPSRNAALGRESTPAEREYLSQPDAGW